MKVQPYEQLLEHCLQEVARTGDAEAVLAHYPQHADRLRPLLQVALATSQMYADVPAPPRGLAAGRERLLEAAAQQRAQAPATRTLSHNTERKPKMQLLFATKIVSAVLAVMVSLSAVGGGAAVAANGSIPGDVLYPVKLTSEDVRMALASAPAGQVALALQFADQRVAEIRAMVGRERQVPETVVTRMEQHVSQAMNQAARASDEEMPGLLERIMQRTQAQAQALEQLRARAQEQNQAQLEEAERICEQAHEEARAGLDDPRTFRARYQHREGMPEDVTPPQPSTPGPQGNGEGPSGPGEPGQNETGLPQGEQQRDRDREQDCDGEQGQECDPQQDQDQDRQQDQEQDRDQQQDQDCDGEQGQECDPQQDQDRQQDQERDRDQQQDPQQGQPEGQQQEQQRTQEQTQQGQPEGQPEGQQQEQQQTQEQNQEQTQQGQPEGQQSSPQGGR
jgi:hypothetical protein